MYLKHTYAVDFLMSSLYRALERMSLTINLSEWSVKSGYGHLENLSISQGDLNNWYLRVARAEDPATSCRRLYVWKETDFLRYEPWWTHSTCGCTIREGVFCYHLILHAKTH